MKPNHSYHGKIKYRCAVARLPKCRSGKEPTCQSRRCKRHRFDPWVGQEDPLEAGMATHSSILAWRIPMNRGAWWAIVHGVAKSRTRLSN